MRMIDDITSFVFVEDQPRQADIIFVPGCAWPQLCERAAELYHAGFASYILPTGKFSYKRDRFCGPLAKQGIYNGAYATEWEFERDVLIKNGVPETAILCEDRSTHTVDNARFSREATDALGLTIHKAILCCKAYHSRRCLMTYGWVYPDTELFVCPVETQGISRDNWHTTEQGRERVLSELNKCGSYFGDAVKLWGSNQ